MLILSTAVSMSVFDQCKVQAAYLRQVQLHPGGQTYDAFPAAFGNYFADNKEVCLPKINY